MWLNLGIVITHIRKRAVEKNHLVNSLTSSGFKIGYSVLHICNVRLKFEIQPKSEVS